MKKSLLLLPLLLTACGPSSMVHHSPTYRSIPNRVDAREARGLPVRGKEYPVAELIPGQPGFVRSPYTQEPIHLSRLKKGPLVEDPTVRLATRYFMLPQ